MELFRPGNILYPLIVSIILIAGCEDSTTTPVEPDGDLKHIPYAPVPYTPAVPEGFPRLEQPEDNRMTVEGIQLGRKLFFDPVLSVDSTISCASCHLQNASFTDNQAVSTGVFGRTGARSAMSLLNVGFYNNGLFWDGRRATLEEQALDPIEDPVEMHDSWPNVEEKLKRHPVYPADFRRAFGIEDRSEISKYLVTRALAQFERSLISSGQSRYDKFVRGEVFLNDAELNGYEMFFDTSPDLPDAECGHCHNAPLFTTNEYFNNGIQEVEGLDDFKDKGLGLVTNLQFDNGKFRVPTLRNIEYTAPYMHDGRFQTLEEVIDHYNSGGFNADNKDPLIRPLGLTPKQKRDLLAFIRTLNDTTFLQQPEFGNPF